MQSGIVLTSSSREPHLLATLPPPGPQQAMGQGAGKPKSFAALMAAETSPSTPAKKQATPTKKSTCWRRTVHVYSLFYDCSRYIYMESGILDSIDCSYCTVHVHTCMPWVYCIALPCCLLTLLASFFLPSHLSLKHVHVALLFFFHHFFPVSFHLSFYLSPGHQILLLQVFPLFQSRASHSLKQ